MGPGEIVRRRNPEYQGEDKDQENQGEYRIHWKRNIIQYNISGFILGFPINGVTLAKHFLQTIFDKKKLY